MFESASDRLVQLNPSFVRTSRENWFVRPAKHRFFN